ncbi:hypothetical protein, partial [Rubellimicrobium rubrum]|uniref:hypothetical protein n=1 Tax=Rubellimicrobium rubrum TaxID=2585369 RepID=UPI001C3F3EDD
MAARYTDLVCNLEGSLRNESVVQSAHELLARIIEEVTLTPDPNTPQGLQECALLTFRLVGFAPRWIG